MEQPPFVMRVMYMQRHPVLLFKKKADEKGRFFLESRKKQRTCVVNAMISNSWAGLPPKGFSSRRKALGYPCFSTCTNHCVFLIRLAAARHLVRMALAPAGPDTRKRKQHLILYLPLNTQNNRVSSFLHFFPKQRLVQLRRRFQHAAALRALGNHLPQRAVWIAPQRGDKITPGSARHIEAGL